MCIRDRCYHTLRVKLLLYMQRPPIAYNISTKTFSLSYYFRQVSFLSYSRQYFIVSHSISLLRHNHISKLSRHLSSSFLMAHVSPSYTVTLQIKHLPNLLLISIGILFSVLNAFTFSIGLLLIDTLLLNSSVQPPFHDTCIPRT